MIGTEAAISQLSQALSEAAAACRNLSSLPFPAVYSAAIGIRYVVLSRRSGITPALLSRKQFQDSVTGPCGLFASPPPPSGVPLGNARITADLALMVTPADLYPVVWYATSLFLSLEDRDSVTVSIAVGIYTGVYFKVARPYQLDVYSFELPFCMLGLKAEAFRLGFLVTRDVGVSMSLGECDIANIARNIASACRLYCLLFPDNWNSYLIGSFAAQILCASSMVVLPTADFISIPFPSPHSQFTIADSKDPVRLSGEIRSIFGDTVAIGRAAPPPSDAPSVERQISALSAEIEYGIQLDSALHQASQAFSQP